MMRIKEFITLMFVFTMTVQIDVGINLRAADATSHLKLSKKKHERLELCVSDAYGKPIKKALLKEDAEPSLTSGYIHHYGSNISFERRVYLGGASEILNYPAGSVQDGFLFLQNCFTKMAGKKMPRKDEDEFLYEYPRDFLTCFYKVMKENGHFLVVTGCQS